MAVTLEHPFSMSHSNWIWSPAASSSRPLDAPSTREAQSMLRDDAGEGRLAAHVYDAVDLLARRWRVAEVVQAQ